ncbi:MAG: shikimate dehydrogenase [Acidimicrobiales bacterium]
MVSDERPPGAARRRLPLSEAPRPQAPPLRISGATVVAAVVGDPVAHSLSPRLHNAAFAATGLDWVLVALPVATGDGAAAVEAIRTLGIRGASVTMPHKQAVARGADRRSPRVELLGAANMLYRAGQEIVAESTDGQGLVAALADEGFDPRGRRVSVLGAGGAARSAVLALTEAGAARVVVFARRGEAAEAAAALAGSSGSAGSLEEATDCDLIVNATPVGMAGGAAPGMLAVGAESLGAGQLVVDMVYEPEETPLLRAARAGGARAVGGLGMLVHQAACGFTLWTGIPAPLEAMRAAVGAASRAPGVTMD